MSIFGNDTVYGQALTANRAKVRDKYGELPYNCTTLDRDLKRISDEIAFERTKIPDLHYNQRTYIEALEEKKYMFESAFTQHNCRDVIEDIRLNSSAIEQTKFAIKQEQSILGRNFKEQGLYIGIGAVVMLIGLFIVLNNNNK